MKNNYNYGGRIGYALGGNQQMMANPNPNQTMMRDSQQGLGSMMASATDKENDPYRDMKVPTDMIDDPEGTMQTDETEIIMQLMKSGQITQLDESEQEYIFDILLEQNALPENIKTFEDFKAFTQMIASNRKDGIMSTMRG